MRYVQRIFDKAEDDFSQAEMATISDPTLEIALEQTV